METRRNFIKKISVGLCGLALNISCKRQSDGRKVCFGVITDVHQDLQRDAVQRLQRFLDAAEKRQLDFIIQLGDLSHGKDLKTIKSVWERYAGKKYSVLGNHDMDHSTKAVVTKELDMPGCYYSYDIQGVHFVVLDSSYMREDDKFLDFDHDNYFRATAENRDWVAPVELEWLKSDLKRTEKPTVIFSHQGFDELWGIGGGCPNRKEVRAIIDEANRDKQKVIACFCGHNHVDAYEEINGVHYFEINSASYFWTDASDMYSNGHMIEYKDSLYAFVSLDFDSKEIVIEGCESEFLPPAPQIGDFPNSEKVYPYIKNRQIGI